MKSLGSNIKYMRKAKGLTLAEVAKNTGIDVATLSRIENGKMTGTIQSHMAIARALDVRLPDLYEKAMEAFERPKAEETKSAGLFSHTGGSVSELLTSGVLQKKLMPVRLKLKAGGRTATEELPLGSERFVYVLAGKLEVVIKGNATSIEEGESLYFNPSLPHHFANKLKTVSSCLIVTTPVTL